MQWSPWQQKPRGHLRVCSSACTFLFLRQSAFCDAAVTNTPRLLVVMTVVVSGPCNLWAAVGCGRVPVCLLVWGPRMEDWLLSRTWQGKVWEKPNGSPYSFLLLVGWWVGA